MECLRAEWPHPSHVAGVCHTHGAGELWALGLEATVHYDRTMPGLGEWEGDFIILKSLVKRYGDMASFGVCVYEVGQKSFYDAQREVLEIQRLTQEASHAT